MLQVDGVVLAHRFADAAFVLFEVKTAFIDICDKGNCLSEVYMDGFILRYFLVVLIRILGGAILYTGSAARAFLLDNIPGLLQQGYREVSLFPFYTVNFRIRQDFYVGMPADLDQFG